MKAEKRVYCAPSLEACGSLRTLTSTVKQDPTQDPTDFDSPAASDLTDVSAGI